MTLKALRTLFLAVMLGAPAAAPAATPPFSAEDRAAVERASAVFNGVTDMQGDFVQVGPNGERTNGKFYYSRPGRIRFDYAKPMTLQVLADGQTLAVRDTKQNTQDVLPLAQTPLRFILADKVDLLRDAKVIAVEKMGDVTTIVLEDKSAVSQGRLSIVFEGPEFKLRQWTVTDAQGLDTTVALYNVETGKKMAPSTFTIRLERMLTPSGQ
jgi:outer membrane lipoprotein-sorting protein